MIMEHGIRGFRAWYEHVDAQKPDCLQRFTRLCVDAYVRGWHEANGGNLSYRLDEADLAELEPLLHPEDTWHALAHAVFELAGEHFLISASGAYLGNVACDAPHCCGVIELDAAGAAWRCCWGFEDNACPSSELETHLAVYAAASGANDGANRVVYHAHCPHVIALSTLIEPDTRTWTRVLWRCMTEGIIVFPQGVGAIEWMVPGSPELAEASCELMAKHAACVWTQHGVMARAASFDEAFGIIETIEKSAGIYLQARAASGGAEPRYLVSDEQLRAICARYELQPDESFLE